MWVCKLPLFDEMCVFEGVANKKVSFHAKVLRIFIDGIVFIILLCFIIILIDIIKWVGVDGLYLYFYT